VAKVAMYYLGFGICAAKLVFQILAKIYCQFIATDRLEISMHSFSAEQSRAEQAGAIPPNGVDFNFYHPFVLR
jgi:hypothetical protein